MKNLINNLSVKAKIVGNSVVLLLLMLVTSVYSWNAMTQESTAEINQIMEKLQSGSRNAVQAMSQSREQTGSVVDQATLAGSSLVTIVNAVSEINEMSAQIATVAEEQNSVSEDMNRNIVRIRDMAVENATGATQTSQASNDLARMSSELQVMVGHFRV